MVRRSGTRKVYVVDNGDIPFGVELIYVNGSSGIAHVGHRRNRGTRMDMHDGDRPYRLWRTIAYDRAWVGLDPCERLPRPVRCHRSWWHGGNAVLLRIGPEQYIYVGDVIFAFKTQPADTILQF